MILASKLACVVFTMFTVQTMLFIYIATAAILFIALDAAVTSFPQRTNTLFFFFYFFKSQISEIMQHVLPNTEQVCRE